MSKHTPGPWRIMQCLPKKQEYEGQTETCIVDDNNRNILNRSDLFEEAADARLIAAAPELLDSLKQTVASLEYWFPRNGDPKGANSQMMKNARAAIAKAEGGAE